MTVVLDRNPVHGLALVGEPSPGGGAHHVFHYVGLKPGMMLDNPHPDFNVLTQQHYLARITAQGLVIIKEEPMLLGWEVYDDLKRMYDTIRGAT